MNGGDDLWQILQAAKDFARIRWGPAVLADNCLLKRQGMTGECLQYWVERKQKQVINL